MICSKKYRWTTRKLHSLHASMTLWYELRLDLTTWAVGVQWNPHSCYHHSLTLFLGPLRLEFEKDVTGKCTECPSLTALMLVWDNVDAKGKEEPL
jgi:hypothetical protein